MITNFFSIVTGTTVGRVVSSLNPFNTECTCFSIVLGRLMSSVGGERVNGNMVKLA